MEWISGVGRDANGKLNVQAQYLDGARAWTDFETVSADLRVNKSVRRKTELALHDLAPITAAEYLEGLRLTSLDPYCQQAYEAETSAGTVVIPSQLLVLGTMGSARLFRQALLRPWGPEHLMHVDTRGGAFDVVPSPDSMLRRAVDQPKMAARIGWVLAYPSARAAWCSVHHFASTKGRIDMLLPKANATVSLRGVLVNGKLLVTRMQVLELAPFEEPFKGVASCAPRTFRFSDAIDRRPNHGKAAAPTADASIARDGRVVPLTDAEWTQVEPLILQALGKNKARGRGAPRAHALRDLVECVRLKLGTPFSWSTCPGNKALVRSASVLLSKLRRAGVWEPLTRSTLTTEQ